MIEPLRLSWEVDCSPSVAFRLWTERTDLWWPAGHSDSREKGAAIVFEPRVEGRIYERGPSGVEKDWGTVLYWDPPHRLVYRWHLFSEPKDATEVEVHFRAKSDGTTTVSIEHRGWDAFDDGAERRDNNEAGWRGLIPPYVGACNTPYPY
jgi:uncharacterized protein YndB with AHSA1/START domain